MEYVARHSGPINGRPYKVGEVVDLAGLKKSQVEAMVRFRTILPKEPKKKDAPDAGEKGAGKASKKDG